MKFPVIILLSLAAIALASGRYLSVDRTSVPVADSPAFSGIASVYRQFPAGGSSGAVFRDKATALAVEDSGFDASFLRLDDSSPTADADAGETAAGRAGSGTLGRMALAAPVGQWPAFGAAYRRSLADDFSGPAALVLNGSFASLFASIYDPQGDALNRADEAAVEGALNPFSRAKQKEKERRAAAAPAEASRTAEQDKSQEAASETPADQQAMIAAGPIAPSAKFVFLGDFDGSGVLSAAAAVRTSEQAFTFPDGSRAFSLFVTPSAVERQRSIAIEDVNGDGFADLLTATASSLFGGILLGNSDGEYEVAGTFLTGYEPVLVTVGPQAKGGRKIVTVNRRTGELKVYDPRSNYRRYNRVRLGIQPEYISHLVELETGADILLAARSGAVPSVYNWRPEDRLERRMEALPAEPGLVAAPDGTYASDVGSVQVHQVGPYASVILANRTGQAFNVASLRVSPSIFLVFGDLEGRGHVDMGVASLLSFTPPKQAVLSPR